MTVNELVLSLREHPCEGENSRREIGVQLDPDAGSSLSSPELLRDLLTRLICYVEHSHAGRTLTISTQRVSLNGKMLQELPEVRSGEYVMLSVKLRRNASFDPSAAGDVAPVRLLLPAARAANGGRAGGTAQTVLLLGRQSNVRASLRNILLAQGYEVLEGINEHHTRVACRNFGQKIDAVVLAHEPGDGDAPGDSDWLLRVAQGIEREPAADAHRVLIVDDDSEVRKSLAGVLQSAGYCVSQARNGREALQIIGTRVPALVITELVMPDTDGLQLIQNLRKAMPELKIVAMSGGPRAGTYLSVARAFGARRTIRKPLQSDEVLEVVEQVLS